MTNYVTIFEEYKHKFFQLPKVFFTSDKYKDMSNNAKIAWAILKDRSSLSRKNEWFDKETGRIYFIYKNKELMEILNIKSETTLSNVKKELESAGLIEQERMGFNRPNKLYLIYPVVEEEDIYKIDEFENYEYKEENRSQSQSEKGTSKNGAPNNEVPYPQKMESSNTDSSNTDLKDLDTIDTPAEQSKIPEKMDSAERKQLKERYFEKGFYENYEFVPKEISNVLKVFCSTKEAKEYYHILLLAKKKIEVESNSVIWLEEAPDLIDEIVNTFSRSIRKVEQERDVDNRKGYFYKAFYKTISDYVYQGQRLKNENDNHSGVYFDWLEDSVLGD